MATFIDSRIFKCEIKDKGIGYIAKEDIESGSVLIREKPAFFIPKEEPITSELFQLLYQVVTSKDSSKVNKFMNYVPLQLDYNDNREKILNEYNRLQKVNPTLYRYFSEHIEFEDLLLLANKYIRNAFRIERYGPCILLTGSCLNHSCIPNVVLKNKKGVVIFKTVRKIAQGEEICDHYVDLCISETERRKRLKDQYGFDCRCCRCLTTNSKEKQRLYAECKKIQALRRFV